MEATSIEELPPFIMDIYDWDMGPLEDDFIARCLIPIKDSAYALDEQPT